MDPGPMITKMLMVSVTSLEQQITATAHRNMLS
jgi:hypothetical protein